jgi:hypothetical protein
MTMAKDIEMTVRARAWSGEGVTSVRVLVDASGVVRAWDDVSGHYTTCHALSAGAQRRIRALAKKAA